MVCNRCILVVKQIFDRAGIKIKRISLGIVETESDLMNVQIMNVSRELSETGFEVITNNQVHLVEQIKAFTWQFLEVSGDKEKFGYFLSAYLKISYSLLRKQFSTLTGISLEKYFIKMKIERVKELLVYDNLSLSEIAIKLDYSNVSYLCRQFKEGTGLTPSRYLKTKIMEKLTID